MIDPDCDEEVAGITDKHSRELTKQLTQILIQVQQTQIKDSNRLVRLALTKTKVPCKIRISLLLTQWVED